MAWLVVKSAGRDRAHELDEDVLFIGSEDDAGIRLSGEGIAAKHCQILRVGDSVRVIDLGSPMGTLVNGSKVSQAELADGDVLVVGTASMQFKASAPNAAPAAAAAPPAPRAPAPPAAPAPSAGAPTKRRAGSRRASSSSRSRGAEPARASARSGGGGARRRSSRGPEIAPQVNARGDDAPMVRRNLRKGDGMSDGVMWSLVAVGVVLTGSILYYFLTQDRVDFNRSLTRFQAEVNKGDMQVLAKMITDIREEMIEKDPDNSLRSKVDQLYNQYGKYEENQKNAMDSKDEKAMFGLQVKSFYDKYIDTTDPKFKNDPNTMRYFVESRCEPYLARFAEGFPNSAQVKTWADMYRAKYDGSKPFPEPGNFRSHNFVATFEENLEHYGASYLIWQKFSPTAEKDVKGKAIKVADCVRRGTALWTSHYLVRIDQGLNAKPSPLYGRVLGNLERAWRNLHDIPELAQQMRTKAEAIKAQASSGDTNYQLDMSFMGM